MAEKQIIAATLSVETGNANANLKEVNKNANEVKGSLKETGTAAQTTGKQVENSSGSFGKLKGQMEGLPGPLGQATQGVSKVNSAFKALLANPIVLLITAIVGALALLYKAFTSTNDGADKMEQVFAGVGATINVIRDRILKAASAIGKFFSGDFKGALADARGAVSGIGEEISREFQAAANATRVIQELDDELRNLSVSRAKLNADLAEAKEKINDTDLSTAERRANIAKVREAESKQNAAELAEAEARYNAIKAKNDLSDKSDEQLQQEADALIKLENLRAQSASQNRQLDKLDRQLSKEDAAKRAEANRARLEELKAIAQKEKEFAQQQIEDRKAVTAAWQQYVNAIIEMNKMKADEERKLAEEQQAAMEADFQKEQAIENARVALAIKTSNTKAEVERKAAEDRVRSLSAVGQATEALSDLIGKQTIVGKALGIATALINTYQGASEVIKQKSTLPSPFDIISKVAGVATIIATGLKTVKAITSVQVPGGGAGGGSVSAPSIAQDAPIAPTVSTTTLDQASLNQIGNATSRSYILDSDVANNRERNERLNRAARLGG